MLILSTKTENKEKPVLIGGWRKTREVWQEDCFNFRRVEFEVLVKYPSGPNQASIKIIVII